MSDTQRARPQVAVAHQPVTLTSYISQLLSLHLFSQSSERPRAGDPCTWHSGTLALLPTEPQEPRLHLREGMIHANLGNRENLGGRVLSIPTTTCLRTLATAGGSPPGPVPRRHDGPRTLTFHPLWSGRAGSAGRALPVPGMTEAGRGHPVRRVLKECIKEPKAVCGFNGHAV